MQPPARKVPPSPNANRAETVYIQRIWRGIRARRHFSDLFIVAVEAILGPELTPTPSLYDYDDEIPKSPRHDSPSLEEAQREASYNPSVSCFAHVEASSSRSARRSIAGMPSAMGACASPAIVRGAARWASSPMVMAAGGGKFEAAPSAGGCDSSNHSRTPSGGGGGTKSSCAASGSAAAAAASEFRSTGSVHVRTPSAGVGASGSVGAPAPLPTRLPTKHLRNVSEGANVQTAAAVAAFEANEGVASSDLEFSEEMAESMSIDGLRELTGVLTRVIATRNKELVTLQMRRDELLNEREVRQATVTSLVAQVDRSLFVKEERKKGKARKSAS